MEEKQKPKKKCARARTHGNEQKTKHLNNVECSTYMYEVLRNTHLDFVNWVREQCKMFSLLLLNYSRKK